MNSSMIENIVFVAFVAAWTCMVVVIAVAPSQWRKVADFRKKVFVQWKGALSISLLFFVSYTLGSGLSIRTLLGTIALFCQSLIGLAYARNTEHFEPFPVIKAFNKRKKRVRSVISMIIISLCMIPFGLIMSQIGTKLGHSIFREVSDNVEMDSILPDKWSALFIFFAGSGIAEETMYRLFLVSLLRKLTGRRWPAIILAGIVFGLYHLSPINRMYRVFWHFPISQFLVTCLGGILYGFLYMKRGYETVVLSHTLENWLPYFVFMSLGAATV